MLTKTSAKKIDRWCIKTWKNVVREQSKLKQHWRAWPNAENPLLQILVSLKEGEHSSIAGKQNGTASLEDSLAVSYKIKYILTLWSEPVEDLCSDKHLHMKTYNSFI